MKRSLKYLVLLALFVSCSTSSKISMKNIAYLYERYTGEMLKSRLYNKDSSRFVCFYEFSTDSLLQLLDDNEDEARMHYKLLKSYDSKKIVDSASFLMDNLDVLLVSGSFEFDLRDTGDFVFSLGITEENSGFEINNYNLLDNKSDYSSINFLLKNDKNQVLFENRIRKDQKIKVAYNDESTSYLVTYYYNREFPVADPPFSIKKHEAFNYLPDSIFKISLENGISSALMLEKQGFYHFLADTEYRNGLTVFNFYDGFPEITTASQMLYPLRYITTREEYHEMYLSKNKKVAVEAFWLKVTGNIVRAQNAIKHYYKRVVQANRLFSSYIEGWKTDRGMIYIVFGQPASVYREENFESWVYGEEGSPVSLVLNFVKVNNPFSQNDYRLIRSTNYKENWYFAVDNWRR